MNRIEYSERSVSHLLSTNADEDGQNSLSFSDMEDAPEVPDADSHEHVANVKAQVADADVAAPKKAEARYDSDHGGFLPGFEEDNLARAASGAAEAVAAAASEAARKIRDAADSRSMPPPKVSAKVKKEASVGNKKRKKKSDEDSDFVPSQDEQGFLLKIDVPSPGASKGQNASGSGSGDEDHMTAFRKQMSKQMRENGMFGEGGSVAPVADTDGDIDVDTTMMNDDAEDDVAKAVLNPDCMPHAFMENVLNENGEMDFEKMSALSSATKGSARISKVLKPVVDMDGEQNLVDNDEEGFKFEPCMLPAEYRRRDRLRRKANKRRRTEALRTAIEAGKATPEQAAALLQQQQDGSAEPSNALVAATTAGSAANQQQVAVTGGSSGASVALSNDIGDDHRDFDDEYAQGYSHDGCLLCRRGTAGTTPIPISALDNLIKNYVSNRGYKDEEDLARDLEEQFEKCVRKPANDARKPHEKPIPPLTGEDIYYHMKFHDNDPAIFLCNSIKMLQDHAEQLLHSGMYRVPRTKTRAAARGVPGSGYMNSRERYAAIKPSDVRVNEKYHKMFMDTQKQLLTLYAKDPSKMFLYNKHKTIRFDETKSWINSQRPSYTDNNPKGDIWAKTKERH